MDRQEYIEALKNNLAVFHQLPRHLQELCNEIGHNHFQYLSIEGNWENCNDDPGFNPPSIYRLHPDYKEEPGFVEYPIEYDSHGDSFVSIPRGMDGKGKLYNPSRHKKFIGFVSPDGELMSNMVMFCWSPNKNTPAKLYSYVPALFVDTESYTVVIAQTVRFEK